MKCLVSRIWPVLVIAWMATSGCGSRPIDQPELGRVSGVVTLDGDPLAGVLVSFAPDEGRASHGITDAKGRYELTYIGRTAGAKVGSHRVYITTPLPEGLDESDPEAAKFKEPIPARYSRDTILSAEVQPRRNEIDFALESK